MNSKMSRIPVVSLEGQEESDVITGINIQLCYKRRTKFIFSVWDTDKFEYLMNYTALLLDVPVEQLQFRFKGFRIFNYDTAAKIGMINGDVIVCNKVPLYTLND